VIKNSIRFAPPKNVLRHPPYCGSASRYGWLGGKQRFSDTLGALGFLRARRVPVTAVNNGIPGFLAVLGNRPLT